MIEPAPPIAASAEAALLGDVVARDPLATAARTRLVGLLADQDRFDEAIALAEQTPLPLGFDLALNYCRGLFGRHDPAADRLALTVLAEQLSRADQPQAQARLLAEQGKALVRQGQDGPALAAFTEALRRFPASLVAFERLAHVLLRTGQFAEADWLTGQLQAQGISHSRLLSARTLAKAALGDDAAARALLGQAWLPPVPAIAVPSGWPDLASLNAAAAQEILADPSIRLRRHGTASRHTSRVDHPGRPGAHAVQALLAAIASATSRWIADVSALPALTALPALPDQPHPWLASRPDRLVLQCWCVVTGAEGLERWHMHNAGWLSGGYYIAVPPAVTTGTDRAGCLAFGLPPELVGADAAQRFGERLVRPAAGMLSLFPSHAHHRTYPHGAAEQRICLAFDLVPA